MNPYTSLLTGVTPGDGPQNFHLVLMDSGRTDALTDPIGRPALHCIRCSACLNVCPVYERVGGHAYESTCPGPIGEILTPQLSGMKEGVTLPWASSLCGACYGVCPVKIDIPSILVHLRSRVIKEGHYSGARGERAAVAVMARVLSSPRRYERAQQAARIGPWPLSRGGRIERQLPGPLEGSTSVRDLPALPKQTFRDWWREHEEAGQRPAASGSSRRSAEPSRTFPADEPDTWTLPDDGRELESALPPAELAALLAERIDDYRAHVTRCGSGVRAIRRAVGQACARHKVKSLLIPGGLDHSWFSKQLEALTDKPSLSPLTSPRWTAC